MTTSTEDTRRPVRSTTAHSRELGEELRRVRKHLRLKGTTICNELGWSQAKLSKLEGGKRGTTKADVATLLGFYRADKTTRTRILGLVNKPDYGSFVRAHGGGSPDELVCLRMHEAQAKTLTCYEPLVVPTLLHTELYAEALLTPILDRQEQRDAWIRSRTDRQAVLRRESAPKSVFFIHEVALHLVVDDATVMHDQCMQLSFMATWAELSLRVVPLSTGHAALRHAATRLTFSEHLKPLVYMQTDTATVFYDEKNTTTAVQRKFAALDELALSTAQSQTVFRRWAEVYDRAAPPEEPSTLTSLPKPTGPATGLPSTG